MSIVETRLAVAGFTVPGAAASDASYLPTVRVGALIFTSGQIPLIGTRLVVAGRLGEAVDVDQGRVCAQVCALHVLAQLKACLGDLDSVRRIVKLTVFIASAASFCDQSVVADGASDLMAVAFGESGRHARSAVGVAALPFGSPVEVEAIAEAAEGSGPGI